MAKQRKIYKTTRRIKTKKKTTTPEGKRDYMRRYMQVRRAELRGDTGNLEQMSIEKIFGLDLKKLQKVRRPLL